MLLTAVKLSDVGCVWQTTKPCLIIPYCQLTSFKDRADLAISLLLSEAEQLDSQLCLCDIYAKQRGATEPSHTAQGVLKELHREKERKMTKSSKLEKNVEIWKVKHSAVCKLIYSIPFTKGKWNNLSQSKNNMTKSWTYWWQIFRKLTPSVFLWQKGRIHDCHFSLK